MPINQPPAPPHEPPAIFSNSKWSWDFGDLCMTASTHRASSFHLLDWKTTWGTRVLYGSTTATSLHSHMISGIRRKLASHSPLPPGFSPSSLSLSKVFQRAVRPSDPSAPHKPSKVTASITYLAQFKHWWSSEPQSVAFLLVSSRWAAYVKGGGGKRGSRRGLKEFHLVSPWWKALTGKEFCRPTCLFC